MKINKYIKQDISAYLNEQAQKEKNKVTVYSHQSLTKEDIENIYLLIPSLKDRPIETIIDRDILAGIIIRFGSKILDLSLNSKLKNLEKDLNETS